ncbi:hypothetical protein [Photobacterium kishitanii]|uniref:Uncharacterized protein n=1 Tax=Photobacterium kishitanii TaxID=318456 RepID=A0A2T3KLZ7_9GAMM|nr:hypothetical protein [Photobacterium kishitanii]PSV00706.1 hypothetical protein C9J27_06075 [Photobacterium kishitanii]
MSTAHRPRLTRSQITDFKSDTKLLARLVVNETRAFKGAKFGVTSLNNAISRALGFTSFSELVCKEVLSEAHADFDIIGALTAQQWVDVFNITSFSDHSVKPIQIERINNAISEFKKRRHQPSNPSLSAKKLLQILSETFYFDLNPSCDDGKIPNEFVVACTDEFFCDLEDWDHFLVKTNNLDYTCFTVQRYMNMYTNEPMFKVFIGRWYENGLCVGNR